jgi:hypothetical protein
LASWTVPEFTAASGAGLDEAVHAADVFLARSRMLVAQEGWQHAGERATATLVPVTDTPAWRGISWACTVACSPDALGKATWYLERQLAAGVRAAARAAGQHGHGPQPGGPHRPAVPGAHRLDAGR